MSSVMHDMVISDPRFLYSYSPQDTAADTRYKFVAGHRSPERSIKTLVVAYEWILANPPTAEDFAKAEKEKRT